MSKETKAQQPHSDLSRLEAQLGYQFEDRDLLLKALTHRSVRGKGASYERFEFLGDAIIGFYVAEYLFNKFPHADEGALTRARSEIVRRETLAECAVNIELGDFLILGAGELKSGGHSRATILSDAVESVVAAVFLDADLNAAKEVIAKILAIPLEVTKAGDVNKDAKTSLQEYLQQNGRLLPEYLLVNEEGPDHDRQFTVECIVDDIKTTGIAGARRRAEQDAAQKMLAELGVIDDA